MRLNLLCLQTLLLLNYVSELSARLTMKPLKRFKINNLHVRTRRAFSYDEQDYHEIIHPYYPYSDYMEQQPDWNYFQDHLPNYIPEKAISSRTEYEATTQPEESEEMESPYYVTEEESVTESTTTTTTTPEPWDVNDIKVPTKFLRIEYMTSFVFLGLWYGLGFLVMFQSLVVPATKLILVGVYYVLTKYAGAPQWDVQDALDQLPPD